MAFSRNQISKFQNEHENTHTSRYDAVLNRVKCFQFYSVALNWRQQNLEDQRGAFESLNESGRNLEISPIAIRTNLHRDERCNKKQKRRR
jgi:hypothetical protein